MRAASAHLFIEPRQKTAQGDTVTMVRFSNARNLSRILASLGHLGRVGLPNELDTMLHADEWRMRVTGLRINQ